MEDLKETVVNYPFLTKKVKIYERKNGHKIVLAYKKGGLANISTWVQTGSINEDDKINGISHFLEHLMFKGTTTRKVGEFDKILESKGGMVNAATWKDYTYYYVTLPSGPKGAYFDEAIELHADMMLNATLPDFEIGEAFDTQNDQSKSKRERHVVIEEIRMRKDQPWTKLYNALNSLMYTKHPYKRDVIGTPEIISSVPRDTIYNYYKTWYTPKNMTTVLVGDFDFESTLKKVLKAFDYKQTCNQEAKIYPIDTIDSTRYVENTADVNTGFLMFGYLCPKAKELKENIALDMLSIILGEGQSSRLYQNLIEKADKHIFNQLSTDFYHFRDSGNFFVQANFDYKFKDEALKLIKAEIQKVIDNKVSINEFKKAQKKLKVRFAENAESVTDIADYIGSYMTVEKDLTLVEDYIDILQNMDIDYLQQIAADYLDINKAAISVLMPEKD